MPLAGGPFALDDVGVEGLESFAWDGADRDDAAGWLESTQGVDFSCRGGGR